MSQTSYSHLWPGVPLALGSAVLFGLTAPMSKLLLGSLDPQLLAGMLYLRRSDVPWLSAVVLFGGVLGPLLLMTGLASTDAASGSLLLNLEGLATMGIAWIVFRENVDRSLLAGALAILIGAAVLSWEGGGFHIDTGGVLVAGACFCWGIDNNLTRKLSSADPVLIAMIKGLAAGLVNSGAALVRGADPYGVGPMAAAAVLGFLAVGVSLVLFILALRYLGTARTGAYFSLAPFIGAVAAIVVLHEPLTTKLMVAGACMAAGLWLHLSERHQHAHEHEPFEHEHGHEHDAHHGHPHDGDSLEPHSHKHHHDRMVHAHSHYPDLHHRHTHPHG
jgi:drug/metabolite transporter (DMT)-like permease